MYRWQNGSTSHCMLTGASYVEQPGSNQIYLVTFMCVILSWHKLYFYKKINCCKMFFDICNAEKAQSLCSLQKSELLKLIILIFM